MIRQYDHEVQGGSVVKPLVGVLNDGPSDAAVIRPVLASRRGLVVGVRHESALRRSRSLITWPPARSTKPCGIASPSEPIRRGSRCWIISAGATATRPETLGSLVRAALACYDMAIALGTPFISGKDSLNNEFRYTDSAGKQQTIAIPPSLLISAMGQIDDVSRRR